MCLFVLVMCVGLIERRESPTEVSQPESLVVDDLQKLRDEIGHLKEELAEVREKVRLVVVAARDKAAPEIADRMERELDAKSREALALRLQVEELRRRVVAAEAVDAENRRQRRELEEARRRLQERLVRIQNRKGVTLIPERGELKAPIYLICGRGGVELLLPQARSVSRKFFLADEMGKSLREELSKHDHTTHTVVILVRPSGIKYTQFLSDMLQEFGLTYGRDPLEEDVEVALEQPEGAS